MQFVSVKILKNNHGPDECLFSSDLPSPMPNVTQEPAYFKLHVAAGDGEAYVRKHFPDLIPMVIEYPVLKNRFLANTELARNGKA